MDYVLHLTTSMVLIAALSACGGGQTGSGKPAGSSGGRTGTSQTDGPDGAADGAGGKEVTPASEDVEVPPAP